VKADAKLEWMLIIETLQGANILQGRLNNQQRKIKESGRRNESAEPPACACPRLIFNSHQQY